MWFSPGVRVLIPPTILTRSAGAREETQKIAIKVIKLTSFRKSVKLRGIAYIFGPCTQEVTQIIKIGVATTPEGGG